MTPAFTFSEARACVLEQARLHLSANPPPAVETIALDALAGRILASAIAADRDYPATARSVRDGFAVRAQDTPGRLRVAGETRAGEPSFSRAIGPGEAVEIMTGAPMPPGADAVVMVEYSTRHDDGFVTLTHASAARENFNPQGCEARAGQTAFQAGTRLDYSGVALLATYGFSTAPVFAKPTVAILATGDELVEIAETPTDFQIRNSNSYSLAAQVRRAGGVPRILPVARDRYDATRELMKQGLESELLLLSGGVSAGKYDLVEQVLADLGAQFFFTRVRIQPGQPLVFGAVRGKLFFGLPGNPASTVVTFEVFARAAIEILGGLAAEPVLPLTWAKLTSDFKHKAGLTRFLPAHLDGQGNLTPLSWSGSGDVPALARANAYLVADPDRERYAAGDFIQTLSK